MRILRRFLYVQAVVWAAAGLALAIAPGLVVEDLFGQPPAPDSAWIRLTGLMMFALALFMVLVAQRANEVWWWSWGFALPAVVVALVAAVNALGGRPDGAPALLWWIIAGLNATLAAGLMWGLGRTAQERPLT